MPRYDLYEAPWYSSTSPGDSSVPANRPPIITQCAPATIALAMSPEKRMPPSAISGTPVRCERRGDVRDGADLRHADACDDARRADRARADADLDGVGARVDERVRGFGRHDVAGDDLLRRPLRLDALDRLDHAARMAVRGVDDDHVDARLAQRRDALERVRRRADRRADAQRAAFVLAGARELGGLLEVLDRDHARELEVAVDHQHLLDAVPVQQREHFFLRRVLAHGDEPLARRHHLGHRRVELRLEPQVAMRDDADGLAVAHDRHAGDVLARA